MKLITYRTAPGSAQYPSLYEFRGHCHVVVAKFSQTSEGESDVDSPN